MSSLFHCRTHQVLFVTQEIWLKDLLGNKENFQGENFLKCSKKTLLGISFKYFKSNVWTISNIRQPSEYSLKDLMHFKYLMIPVCLPIFPKILKKVSSNTGIHIKYGEECAITQQFFFYTHLL